MMVAALASQVALAAGGLCAAARLAAAQSKRVISAADATVLARRSTVGLIGGLLTVAVLPAAAVAFPHAAGHTWTVFAWVLAGVGVAAFAAAAPTLIASFRLRPNVEGPSGDLIADLGGWVPADLTPTRVACVLALVIVVAMGVAGVFTDDPYDGAFRGIADGMACLAGFAVLGHYADCGPPVNGTGIDRPRVTAVTYLNALESELATVGIPARRRARIIAEFTDHLEANPAAELGQPNELARQFADELGTRLARTAAFRAFAALAIAGVGLAAMFLAAGRWRGLSRYGTHQPVTTPTWTLPIMLFVALVAQVAFVAGTLALLRAWRLRHERVIGRADAVVLARRSAVGLLCGALTMAGLPAIALAFPHTAGHTWTVLAWVVAAVASIMLASVAPTVLGSARLRPASSGEPADTADLTADLGPWLPSGLTPTRCALLLAAAIVAVMSLQGVIADDPFDGIARGLLDAVACLAGFAVLGRYLGLRTGR